MREVLKDPLVGFLGALLVECAPKAALFLVRLAVRAMPPDLREQMLNDWTAEVLSAEGNAQKLVAALWILVNVPGIRNGYGYSPIPIDFKNIMASAIQIPPEQLFLKQIEKRVEKLERELVVTEEAIERAEQVIKDIRKVVDQ